MHIHHWGSHVHRLYTNKLNVDSRLLHKQYLLPALNLFGSVHTVRRLVYAYIIYWKISLHIDLVYVWTNLSVNNICID